MDLSDLLGVAKTVGIVGGVSAILGYAFVMDEATRRQLNGRRITSKYDLVCTIKHEARKLGMRDMEFIVILGNEDYSQYDDVSGKHVISVDVHEVTRETIKHELYHIYKGHTKTKYNPFRFHLWQEPQAKLYGAFNIKL